MEANGATSSRLLSTFPPYLFRMYAFFSVLLCCIAFAGSAQLPNHFTRVQGAFVRGDSTRKEVSLLFTADEWGEGLPVIEKTLQKQGVKGSFFFTGRFYRNKEQQPILKRLNKAGHYFGPHSDQHLLYCDWNKRDSLLVTKDSLAFDLEQNKAALLSLGFPLQTPHLFVPPYEWWNDSVTVWSKEAGFRLVSFTPGIRTNADYTWPEMGNAYKSTEWILQWLKDLLTTSPQKLNGAIILVHAGTDPRRKDKLYDRLEEMIKLLQKEGFRFRRIDELFPLP